MRGRFYNERGRRCEDDGGVAEDGQVTVGLDGVF